MTKFSWRLLICVVALSVIAACQFQRAAIGTAQNQAQWDVQPPFFCPGDPVTVSWDMSHLPRSATNCNPPTVTSCTYSSTCPGGASGSACVDDFCCPHSVFSSNPQQCPTELGCLPAFSIGITSDNAGSILTGETHQVTGSRSVSPSDTTTFTINGLYNPPPIVFNDSKVSTLVKASPATLVSLSFPFTCNGGPGWAVQDFNHHPLATEHAVIAGVRNNTSHTILLSVAEPVFTQFQLAPGETTSVLNGAIVGVWSVQLAPTDPARVLIPRCEPTNIRNPWPDLSLELHLQCSAM